MTERELNAILMDTFPELKAELAFYIEEEGDGMDTGCFLAHEDILHPFIDEALRNGDRQTLKQVGAYIEHLLDLGDEYTENVVIVGLIEWLALERADAATRIPLGPKARMLLTEYSNY